VGDGEAPVKTPALHRYARALASAFWMTIGLAVILLDAQWCPAHPANLAAAIAKVDSSGKVHVTLTFDLLAYALNDTPQRVANAPMDALLDGQASDLQKSLAEAKERFARGIGIVADGNGVKFDSLVFPGVKEVEDWKKAGYQPRLPVMMELSVDAHLPQGARTVAFRFPEALGQVILTVERPGVEPRSMALEAGVTSPDFPVHLDGNSVTRKKDEGNTNVAPSSAGARERQGSSAAKAAAEPSRLDTVARFIEVGFEHILPRGLDHILFVLGLFLLSTRMRPLLWQVTAFTVAHSLTLALALYGIVRLPASVVEPLIAGSIAFVAIENLFTSHLKPWRPVVVFGFGLIHGLGFAGVLTSAGLPRNEFVTALFSFNVGIELGQLTVIAGAMLVVGWFRKNAWYRQVVVVPASMLIAGVGLVWMVQRMM